MIWSKATLLAVSTAACVSVPEPPPGPERTARLEEEYNHPSAVLTPDGAAGVVSWARTMDLMRYAASLEFLHSAIAQANTVVTRADDVTDALHDAQGTLAATIDCPGDGRTPADAAAPDSGSIEVTFGVDDAAIQSGFVGSVDRCRITTTGTDGAPLELVVTMEFQGELGADVPIGRELPQTLLVLGTTGTISGIPGQDSLSVENVNFRLTADGAAEVLLELDALGLARSGSAVVIRRADAVWAVRERRGTWACGTEANACVPHF